MSGTAKRVPNISELFDKNRHNLNLKRIDIPKSLQDIISGVVISKIPEQYNANCFQHLDVCLHFTDISTSDEILERLVEGIFNKKANAKSNTLLIWACDVEIKSNDEQIVDMLRKHAPKSQFDNVYYFSSLDGEGWFEANKKVFAIKENENINTQIIR